MTADLSCRGTLLSSHATPGLIAQMLIDFECGIPNKRGAPRRNWVEPLPLVRFARQIQELAKSILRVLGAQSVVRIDGCFCERTVLQIVQKGIQRGNHSGDVSHLNKSRA